MKKRFVPVLILMATVVVMAIMLLDCGKITGTVLSNSAKPLILIDPGHGGMDGGAVSSDGVMEKDINLSIAKQLQEYTAGYRCHTVMTRETDQWLCRSDTGAIRTRKTEDLRQRREMILKYKPVATVSIHLNSFKEDPGVRGMQVFYPGKGGDEAVLQQCRSFAETMQKHINENLQPENPRKAMAKDDVFLFKQVISPVIIIECGFLSNPAEADRLKTEKYQQETARCIMAGIAEFTGVVPIEKVKIIDSFK